MTDQRIEPFNNTVLPEAMVARDPLVMRPCLYAKDRSNNSEMAFLPFSSRKRVPVPVK